MGTGRRLILLERGVADSEGREEGLVERVVENLLQKQRSSENEIKPIDWLVPVS